MNRPPNPRLQRARAAVSKRSSLTNHLSSWLTKNIPRESHATWRWGRPTLGVGYSSALPFGVPLFESFRRGI
jgi:hypothetical protein